MLVRVERPFPIYAVPRVWQWIAGFRDRVLDDFSPKTLDEFVARWQADDARGRQTWQVIRDEELGGVIDSARISPVLADLHCIFKRSFWGHETTVTALRLVCEELFSDGVLKITSVALKSNHALVGIVKSLGGKTEGVSVGHTLQGGKPVDVVIMGLLKEAFIGEHVSERIHGRVAGRGVLEPDHQHQLDREHDAKSERNEQHKPHPDAVPVGDSKPAFQLHHQPDGRSVEGNRAVPEPGAKQRQPELHRVS